MASVSATTRPPRPGETDGVDYHFLTPDEFDRRRRGGEFIECFQVFDNGYWYGTLRSEAMAGLRAGKWVVLNIDVQGGMAVMEQFPDAVTIFLRPGSMEELERRLRGRDTENESSIRTPAAKGEMRIGIRRPIRLPGRQRRPGAGDRGNLCNSDSPMGDTVAMIDELREEAIVNKVGGRFKLSTLIQKRLVAINGGARPLVDCSPTNKMEIVIQEILQDKIFLDSELKVQVVGDARAARRNSISRTYERPQSPPWRDRRDRRLQDGRAGEPLGPGGRRGRPSS